MPEGTSHGPAIGRVASLVSGFRGCLIGTLLVAYLLAFSRWGSYLHVPGTSIYVTEILLAVSAGAWWRAGGRWSHVRGRVLVLMFVGIAALALMRLAAGMTLSIDALRDVAPYGYAAAVVLPLAPRRPDAVQRTLRVLRGAMIVHLVLVTITLAAPDVVARLPQVASSGPDSRVLSLRADFNCAVLATLAVLTAAQLLRRQLRFPRAVLDGLLIVWCVGAVLMIGSRAGLLALLLGAVILGATALRSRLMALQRSTRIAVVAVAIVVTAVAVPQLGAFQRLADTPAALGIGVKSGQPEASATGTAKARLVSWRATTRYINKSTKRRFVGVGFGPDFLHDAGAAAILEGTEYQGVRAPHNYFLNTYARLGLLGLVLVVCALVGVLVESVRLLRRSGEALESTKILDIATSMLFLALVVTASLGVILEAPFGAVPAFWAAGWLLRGRTLRPRARREGRPLLATVTGVSE